MDDGPALPLRRLDLSSDAGLRLWLAGPADADAIPEQLWKTLSGDEQDWADRFLRAEDKALFVMTRGILRCLLSDATGVAADEIAFAEGPFGKPYLSWTRGPQFNVSHSGAFALIGLSEVRPVGVDIEKMRFTGDELNVARHFFSDAEYRSLQGLDKDALLTAFYKIWTCKEAVLKACGAGISEHLKDFSVALTEDGFAIYPELRSPITVGTISAEPVTVPPGYVGCYALA